MAIRISPNFYVAKQALRCWDNAMIWGLLASGKRLKYIKYNYNITDPDDTIIIGDAHLPVLWELMTGSDPMIDAVGGVMTLTQRASALLSEIRSEYVGKYKILGAIYVPSGGKIKRSTIPEVFTKNFTKKELDEHIGSTRGDWNNSALLIAVAEKVKGKMKALLYEIDLVEPKNELVREEGFIRFVGIGGDEPIKEINTFLTDYDRACMSELMLQQNNDGEPEYPHVRDYIKTKEAA